MTTPAPQQSIQQKRAHYALSLISSVRKEDNGVQKCFKAYSNTLPAMIQMNGIGQALAFAWQKSNGGKQDESQAWGLIFGAVSHWLVGERSLWGQGSGINVLEALTAGSQQQYQLAQAEAQALLAWIKDFARAEIAGDREVD